MSTEVQSWEDQLKQEAKDVAQLYRPSVGRISLKSGIMSYQGNPIPSNKINVVVLGAAFENQWYEGEYDPNVMRNPACFALSATGADMAPHEVSIKKQATSCDVCEKAKWGSDRKGGKGKDCKARVRLAVLPAAADMSPTSIGRSEVALLQLPVTSVKNWGNYVNRLSAMLNRPPWAVITEVMVERDLKTQFKVLFQEQTPIADTEILGAVSARVQPIQDLLLAPYDYTQETKKEEEVSGKKKKY